MSEKKFIQCTKNKVKKEVYIHENEFLGTDFPPNF